MKLHVIEGDYWVRIYIDDKFYAEHHILDYFLNDIFKLAGIEYTTERKDELWWETHPMVGNEVKIFPVLSLCGKEVQRCVCRDLPETGLFDDMDRGRCDAMLKKYYNDPIAQKEWRESHRVVE